MVRDIMKDPLFLAIKSSVASREDVQVGIDLMDTLRAHREECVGMAANMIGVSKRIIAINNEGVFMLMYNPEILEKKGEYETEEGCLSLAGERHTKRYERIKLKFQDAALKSHEAWFEGFTAQIIQHEVDHCNGILI